ncbi:MAG: glutamate ABC transporter substrate-binding protein [Lapillicoccus sp.]
MTTSLAVPAPRVAAGASALVAALLLAACGSSGYPPTVAPTATSSTSAAAGSGATATPAACTNATQSYDPLPAPTGGAADAALAAIRKTGYLRAGVSADSLLLGSRNPLTGQIEGFDIDVVHAIAKAIFGDENKVQLVVIQSGDRIPYLKDDKVDVVVRNMTMNCARWNDIAFSAEYFQSGLKILVRKGSDVTSLAGLAGKKVCAPNSTSTMDVVQATAGVQAVGAATHTGCLVLFQQGKVDAIAGDDTVLAGLAAQDPYASVPKIAALTSEPYGVGVNKDRVDLVRYVNTVLDAWKTDGRWTTSYDKWFAGPLGAAPQPPPSVYGRAA